MEAGCREGRQARQWGFSRRPGSTAEARPISVFTASLESLQPGRSICFSILNLEATSQCASRLQTSHPNYRWWRRFHRGVLAKPCQWRAEEELPSSAQTPPVPESSDGRRYTFISSAVSCQEEAGPLEETGISSTEDRWW